MAILHVVRCDALTCLQEAPLRFLPLPGPMQEPNVRPSMLTPYQIPSDWKQFDGLAFCTFRCLANYTDAKAQEQEQY